MYVSLDWFFDFFTAIAIFPHTHYKMNTVIFIEFLSEINLPVASKHVKKFVNKIFFE